MRLIGIADTLKISEELFGYIVRESLIMRKLCVKWASQKLTIDQFTVSRINENDKKKYMTFEELTFLSLELKRNVADYIIEARMCTAFSI